MIGGYFEFTAFDIFHGINCVTKNIEQNLFQPDDAPFYKNLASSQLIGHNNAFTGYTRLENIEGIRHYSSQLHDTNFTGGLRARVFR